MLIICSHALSKQTIEKSILTIVVIGKDPNEIKNTIQIQNSLLCIAFFGIIICSEKVSVHWLTVFAA